MGAKEEQARKAGAQAVTALDAERAAVREHAATLLEVLERNGFKRELQHPDGAFRRALEFFAGMLK